MLTQDYLKSIFNYDPETGDFIYLKSTNSRVKVGQVAGTIKDGYPRISINGKDYYAHRLAFFYMTGEWPTNEVDHINCTRDDNRWRNLRLATHVENGQNQRKERPNSKTGFLGVSINGKGFQARIMDNGKAKRLGTFKTPEEAHSAYLEAKRKYHPFSTI